MNLRTPIKRARGLGSAKHGSGVWLAERVSAAALVPLVIWFVYSLICYAGADYAVVREWFASPVTAVLMSLLVGLTAHHAANGMQVIFEDYLHVEWQKMLAIYLVKFIAYLLAAAGIFAVLRVSLGG
ncbi:succinate dehydrogenase, hydrophobic membrane anchor protein [Alkalilimnicola sp. S0819]|uniref:succinate dehydrogenase, hydrophobic membrane anchor protein n=1 Tax=Alkalilimnicola sp. S0819 TaxID=2613922 RepID=UPI00126232B5|nr:succinate dehydrogenase, hydrophobic membrane anchor protein [Alkalilimnicola sp. S0819]KAB7627546.1 succinate dehydrogenase, hydrophobic membrane anchor protein [Alkalilimnicola sp. S0819]MPQ15702.1 succinate dehydrogenase, hydrophobic membrane anchor protein [Alkalilimnicola sp. S0819]